MKMQIWVLSTCMPEDCRPAYPHAFGTQAEALASFERFMRDEWEHHAPLNDEGKPLPFPDGDPREANRLMADNGDMWGEWELTFQTIDVPVPRALQDELAALNRRVSALMQTCKALTQTCRELVKGGVPQAFRDLLALAQGLDAFRDDYRMNAVLRACEAILGGQTNA